MCFIWEGGDEVEIKNEKIGIVILHYKNFVDTINCLNSILELDASNFSVNILIVDNYSADGSAAVIENYIEKKEINVDVLELKANLGFASGNNAGYKFLTEKYGSFDFIICSNNDIEVRDKNFFQIVSKEYEKSSFALVGPDIFSTFECEHQSPMKKTNLNLKNINKRIRRDKKLIIFYKLQKIKLFKVVLSFVYKKNKSNLELWDNCYETRQEDIQLHGSFIVFSKDFFKQNDFCFYPGTFMYLEEIILYQLCNFQKMKIVYSPELCVFHHHAQSTKKMLSNEIDRKIFKISNHLKSYEVLIEMLMRFEDEKEQEGL